MMWQCVSTIIAISSPCLESRFAADSIADRYSAGEQFTWAASALDETTRRKFYLDDPDDLRPGEQLTFLLSLHGGGSVGAWQRAYFPAYQYKEKYRLVIATPSAATKVPARRWVGDADDAHLHHIVEHVFVKYGRDAIRAFWLVGHSQGGMTCNRLLHNDEFFKARVDGWLSLSGGRIGPIQLPEATPAPATAA